MANHLDLEEQEQLDQLKHFWKQYGNLVTWALVVVLAAYAGWNGYQYWQRNQSTQAAAMYDELERVSRQGDLAKVDRAFGDMKERFSGTVYAQQSGLLVARLNYDAGKVDAAKTALAWVVDKSSDESYQAIARLRLAGILADAKSYPEAMAQLAGSFPAEFAGLVADRKGDILTLQGKPLDAKIQYQNAYKALDERTEYRRLVEIKLNALGVDPQPAARPADSASSSAAAAEVAK
jgi:predicted negative regulator of RcsB-dependent stress response